MLAYNIQTQQIKTESFDGPLELLLYLIRKEGVDIRDVKIAPITDAFLGHLENIETMSLDTAGDFLVMAATLCYLKSRELIPSIEDLEFDDEEQDPAEIRKILAQRLIEYQRYKDASKGLKERHWLGRDTFTPLENPDEKIHKTAQTKVDSFGLLKIFRSIIERHEEKVELIIKRAKYSLQEISSWILRKISKEELLLSALLKKLPTKADRVICFLAMLELGRLQYLDIVQKDHLSPVQLIAKFEGPPPQLDLLSWIPDD